MGCKQSTVKSEDHSDRNVDVSTTRRLVFGLNIGKGNLGGVEAKLLGGYESGFKRVYDDDTNNTSDTVGNVEGTALPVANTEMS